MGQPGTGVGPGLGRHLGTVAQHAARPDNACRAYTPGTHARKDEE
jgi:hypothetical protein